MAVRGAFLHRGREKRNVIFNFLHEEQAGKTQWHFQFFAPCSRLGKTQQHFQFLALRNWLGKTTRAKRAGRIAFFRRGTGRKMGNGGESF